MMRPTKALALSRMVMAFLIMPITLLSCSRSEDFLPAAPKKPGRHSKVYTLSMNTLKVESVDVDILWIIDNSGSMSSYQNAVIANSAKFIEQFSKTSELRWRLGLISTTESEGPYLGFPEIVDWQTPNAVELFNLAVGRLGVYGDASEKTFAPVMNILNQYPQFLRPNAFLFLIVVSDEPEQSAISVTDFVNDMVGRIGGNPDRFGTYGVFSAWGSNDSYNQKYKDLITQARGKSYDINSPDYGILLAELGNDLYLRTREIQPVVLLDQRPMPDTIQVTYQNRVLASGFPDLGGEWSYDPTYNLIRIHQAGLLDSKDLKVQVSFEIDYTR